MVGIDDLGEEVGTRCIPVGGWEAMHFVPYPSHDHLEIKEGVCRYLSCNEYPCLSPSTRFGEP